jgi:hypothetical protein
MSFCCALTESVWPALIKGTPRLSILDVSFCGNAVSDDALLLLSQGLGVLTRLSVRGCIRVTDTGVQSLISHAHAMQKVNLTSCKNISPTIIATIPKSWVLLTAQTPLIDPVSIAGSEQFGSHHLRRFTT